MSHLLPGEHGSHLTLLIRSRSLRRRAAETLERAAALRERSRWLVRSTAASLAGMGQPGPPAGHPPGMDADDVDTLQWYRVQVREMLAAGWSAQELADVGITDGLLRELGLHGME